MATACFYNTNNTDLAISLNRLVCCFYFLDIDACRILQNLCLATHTTAAIMSESCSSFVQKVSQLSSVVRKVSELEHFFIDGVMLSCKRLKFQIHWNIIGNMICGLKIQSEIYSAPIDQFRQFCDTLKLYLKFIMQQSINSDSFVIP